MGSACRSLLLAAAEAPLLLLLAADNPLLQAINRLQAPKWLFRMAACLVLAGQVISRMCRGEWRRMCSWMHQGHSSGHKLRCAASCHCGLPSGGSQQQRSSSSVITCCRSHAAWPHQLQQLPLHHH